MLVEDTKVVSSNPTYAMKKYIKNKRGKDEKCNRLLSDSSKSAILYMPD